MKLRFQERFLSSAGVLVLAIILVVLAVLQYRWSGELNEAAGARMRAGLAYSSMHLREDFSRELLALGHALQTDAPTRDAPTPTGLPDPAGYRSRLESWRRSAAHPELFSNLYVWQRPGEKSSRLLRLNPDTATFEPVVWPVHFERLRQNFSSFTEMSYFAFRPERRRGDELVELPRPWMIETSIPALLQAHLSSPDAATPATAAYWLIVELNPDVLQEQVIPEIAERYFSGSEYDVAVVTRDDPPRVVYSSGSHLGFNRSLSNDLSFNLAGPPSAAGTYGGGVPLPVLQERPRERHPERPGSAFRSRMEPFPFPGGGWEVLVRHRKGSMEAALASVRRRHLLVSFGILLVLALTMAMIVLATRKAQRLARLQMEFVAGVSHELRTPLAVITSAAENIADGIVGDTVKLRRYGAVIRNQSHQLTDLVEKILMFASIRQDRYKLPLQPMLPAELVQRALAGSAELIRGAGFTVEKEVEPDLPTVQVDVAAVTHCLQNLIANAVKYGGEARWIGVRACRAEAGKNRSEVQISVQDRGIGIEASDLPRIFDPFFRGAHVIAAQIHGTGLGLSLAKRIAEAMDGSLSVTSKPGQGSTFVLHLPCAEESKGPQKTLEEETRSAAQP